MPQLRNGGQEGRKLAQGLTVQLNQNRLLSISCALVRIYITFRIVPGVKSRLELSESGLARGATQRESGRSEFTRSRKNGFSVCGRC